MYYMYNIYMNIYTYSNIFAIMKTMCPAGYYHVPYIMYIIMYIMYNRTLCAQVPHSHCGDNREGTLFS